MSLGSCGGNAGEGAEGGPPSMTIVPALASLVRPGDFSPMGSSCGGVDDEGAISDEGGKDPSESLLLLVLPPSKTKSIS